jgi:hypothetical protein
MDRISLGFLLAALYNICIILFSKGFGSDLGDVDSLFGPGGCVGVLLWGLAYLALARSYSTAPAVALVFALEKLFYGSHWLLWLRANSGEEDFLDYGDYLTNSFFSIYGTGDLVFMVFFGWVAWRYRDRLWTGSPST